MPRFNEIEDLSLVCKGDTVVFVDASVGSRINHAYEVEVVRVTETRIITESPFDVGDREIPFRRDGGVRIVKESYRPKPFIKVGKNATRYLVSGRQQVLRDSLRETGRILQGMAGSQETTFKVIEDVLLKALASVRAERYAEMKDEG